MANGALAQQAGQLFGTGVVASFDAPGKEIGALPGVDEIAPNPLQAASLAGTLTYTPPKQVVSRRAEQTEGGDFAAPAFEESIFIEPPAAGDVGQVTDLAGFGSLDQNSLNALGLVGVTPLSLEQTFSNLTNITNLDPATTAINLAKNLDPAVAAAINIARGKTIDSLSNALTNPSIIGTPAAILGAHQALSAVLNFDFDKLSSLPDKGIEVIEGIVQGFSDLINDPVNSAKAFVDMAGQHVEGTFGNTVNSFNFNGMDFNVLSKGIEEEPTIGPITPEKIDALSATRGPVTPALVTSFLPGPMKAAPAVLNAFVDFIGAILPGPYSSYGEQHEADLDTMAGAQHGVEVDLGQGIGINAGPFGSVISFNQVDIPGIGPISFALDFDRATSQYGTAFSQYGINYEMDYQSAAMANSLGGLDPEDMELVTDFIDGQMGQITDIEQAAKEVAQAHQAAYEAYAIDPAAIDSLSRADLEYSRNTAALDVAYASLQTDLGFAGLQSAVGFDQSAMSAEERAKASAAVVSYFETQPARALDFEAKMTPEQAKQYSARVRNIEQSIEMAGAFNAAVINAGSFEPGGYNSQDPSKGAMGLANAVQGVTGKMTFSSFDQQDVDVAEGLSQAAKGLGYSNFDAVDWDFVSTAVNEEVVGGYNTDLGLHGNIGDFDAAMDMGRDDVSDPNADISPEADLNSDLTQGDQDASKGPGEQPGGDFDMTGITSGPEDGPEGGPEGGGKGGGKGGEAQAGGDFDMSGITSGPGEGGGGKGGGSAGKGGAGYGGFDADAGGWDCFIKGTPVLMQDGSTKAIEKIAIGDLVAGKDSNANEVKATHIRKPDIPFLYGFNGHKPFVTAYHPFMTKEGWGCFEPEKFKEHRPTAYQELADEQDGKDLIKIKKDCEILRSDNEWVLVEDVVVEGCDPNLTVYNLSVANDKTFVANNYIVHNKGGGPGGKIICTAMNKMYGFGSYRNALWMKYQSSHMAAEEYELGYHKLVMPLVKKMPTNKTIRTVLERIARRRTINIRKELRGQKLPLYYRSMKYTVRPLLFAVGWLVKKNLLSKTQI